MERTRVQYNGFKQNVSTNSFAIFENKAELTISFSVYIVVVDSKGKFRVENDALMWCARARVFPSIIHLDIIGLFFRWEGIALHFAMIKVKKFFAHHKSTKHFLQDTVYTPEKFCIIRVEQTVARRQ